MDMRFRRASMAALLFVLAATTRAAEPQHATVSFLVSPANPVRNISSGDLRRIFLGEISRWSNGHRIVLFVGGPDTPAEQIFLDRLIRMSDIDYSQWWLGAVFRGRVANAPRVVSGAEAMSRKVAVTPDAIGFIITPSAPLEAGVVALTIDGRSPSDPSYPVRER